MKITKKQLQEIIKEEIKAITEEAPEEYRPWKEDVGDGMSELERLADHLMYYVDQPMQDKLYDAASQGLSEVISALVRLGENGYDLVKTSEQKKVSELQAVRTWKDDSLKKLEGAMQNAFQHGAVLDEIIAIANDLNKAE